MTSSQSGFCCFAFFLLSDGTEVLETAQGMVRLKYDHFGLSLLGAVSGDTTQSLFPHGLEINGVATVQISTGPRLRLIVLTM